MVPGFVYLAWLSWKIKSGQADRRVLTFAYFLSRKSRLRIFELSRGLPKPTRLN
jgi:hypothetical protein